MCSSDLGLSGSYGEAGPTDIPAGSPPNPSDTDYPVTCACSSCDQVQQCMQNQLNNPPPPYNPLGPNSNTYAHNMLNHCGCEVNPIQQPPYTVNRSPQQGGPITVYPPTTTTPPGAIGWNTGFRL